MTSAQSKFKVIKRGFPNTLVLVPGWATDYHIFGNLELDYDYILPVEFNPFDFEENLEYFLDRGSIEKISLFGFSLGGFLAADFARKHQEKTEEVILLGLSRRYNLKVLQDIELKLQKNLRAYLFGFYRDCFFKADKEGWAWFKKHLLKHYLEQMKFRDLVRGLDYLSCACLRPESLSGIKKIRIFHGEEDKIAPFKEARAIESYLPQAKFYPLKNSGHMLFLNPDFRKIYYG